MEDMLFQSLEDMEDMELFPFLVDMVLEFQGDLHKLVHQPKQFHKVVDTEDMSFQSLEDMEVMELVQFLVDMVLESLVDLHKLMP
jgi:hypothetical protein